MGEQGLKKARMGSRVLKLPKPSLALKVQQPKVTMAPSLRVAHKIPVAQLLLVARLLQAVPAQGALGGQVQLLKRQLSFPTMSTHHFSLDPAEILHQQREIDSWSCILP